MNKINIIFMGTPDFALPSLKLLNERFTVSLVVTQPDRINRRGNKITYSPIKEYAIENNLNIYQPQNVNSEESINKIRSLNPDYIVVVAYGQIIKDEILEIPKKNIINVHASLLPKYRGAAPIHRAIMNRDETTGVSIMKVGPGLDKGEVYITAETNINNKKLPELHDELSILGSDLLAEYIEKDYEKTIVGKTQEESLATYAHKISKEDGYLIFEDVESEIGKINGLYPRPGATFNYFGERIKVLEGEIYSNEKNEGKNISEIINVDDQGILVNCGNGILLIKMIQFPGKKPMSIRDYLKGNTITLTELR
ncbi:MAG: methionyl-tRNA formyltransferase [Tissierellia bacterium]|nr:methionyl-tRNA formyltransferase [Tissierellia bacterium]